MLQHLQYASFVVPSCLALHYASNLRLNGVVKTSTITKLWAIFMVAAGFPFLAYTFGGSRSWTGQTLTDEENSIISWHKICMVAWLFVSFTQSLSWKTSRRAHKYIGRVGFILLLWFLLDLLGRSIYVFISKIDILSETISGKSDVSNLEFFAFAAAFSTPAVIPLGVMYHGFHGAKIMFATKKTLTQRSLHMHHMMSLMNYMVSPGIARSLAMLLFWATDCVPYEDAGDSIQIQLLTLAPTGVFSALVFFLIRATFPEKVRNHPSVQSEWIMWTYALSSVIACWLLGMDPWPECAMGTMKKIELPEFF